MAKEHHVIYLPGLGDREPRLKAAQIYLLKRWKTAGLTVHFFELGWDDGEAFALKLARAIKLVDQLLSKGHTVSLVGVSAGASAAINVFMERKGKINAVVFICGKLMGSRNINPKIYEKNPAFRDSLALAQANIEKLTAEDKSVMKSLHPLFDETVAVADTKIPGVQTKTVALFFHLPTILAVLSIYRRMAIIFLKNISSLE